MQSKYCHWGKSIFFTKSTVAIESNNSVATLWCVFLVLTNLVSCDLLRDWQSLFVQLKFSSVYLQCVPSKVIACFLMNQQIHQFICHSLASLIFYLPYEPFGFCNVLSMVVCTTKNMRRNVKYWHRMLRLSNLYMLLAKYETSNFSIQENKIFIAIFMSKINVTRTLRSPCLESSCNLLAYLVFF